MEGVTLAAMGINEALESGTESQTPLFPCSVHSANEAKLRNRVRIDFGILSLPFRISWNSSSVSGRLSTLMMIPLYISTLPVSTFVSIVHFLPSGSAKKGTKRSIGKCFTFYIQISSITICSANPFPAFFEGRHPFTTSPESSHTTP